MPAHGGTVGPPIVVLAAAGRVIEGGLDGVTAAAVVAGATVVVVAVVVVAVVVVGVVVVGVVVVGVVVVGQRPHAAGQFGSMYAGFIQHSPSSAHGLQFPSLSAHPNADAAATTPPRKPPPPTAPAAASLKAATTRSALTTAIGRRAII